MQAGNLEDELNLKEIEKITRKYWEDIDIKKYIKDKYKDCEVIAGGGIQNIGTLTYYKRLGADHFSVSSLCFNPFQFGWFYFNYLIN